MSHKVRAAAIYAALDEAGVEVKPLDTVWGLAYVDGPYFDSFNEHWTGGNVSWYYNWQSVADDRVYWGDHPWVTPAPKEFNYVPQLWGMEESKVRQFWNQSAYWKDQGVTHLLGFNEPDHKDQSNIPDGAEGASHWKATLGKFKGRYKLVSPACTSAPISWQWMQNFLAAGADPDAIAIHWYGVDFNEFANYATRYYEAYKKPIWVTEIACTDFVNTESCRGGVHAFMHQLGVFAANNKWLERVSWYGALDLTKSNGYGAVAPENGLCKDQKCPTGRSPLGDQYYYGLF